MKLTPFVITALLMALPLAGQLSYEFSPTQSYVGSYEKITALIRNGTTTPQKMPTFGQIMRAAADRTPEPIQLILNTELADAVKQSRKMSKPRKALLVAEGLAETGTVLAIAKVMKIKEEELEMIFPGIAIGLRIGTTVVEADEAPIPTTFALPTDEIPPGAEIQVTVYGTVKRP